MNLLEHYIKEIYDVETVDMDSDGDGWSFIIVDMMIDCYGYQKRVQHSFSNMEEWEKAQEQGYYLA